MNRRMPLVAIAIGTLLAGCSADAPSSAPSPDGVSVVATTTIWGDIAGEVVDCAGPGTTTTLIPVGADPHDYSPSSQEISQLLSADLVVANGLGLEEGLESSIDAARADGATVYEVAPDLNPMPLGEPTESDHAGADDHGREDPHVWLDAQRAALGAANIGSRLSEVTGDPTYADCGRQVQAELETLDAEVAQVLDQVAPDRRVLVTDHDALGYFADAYGFRVAGTVVPGGSTLAEPSSEELAALADTVRAAGVPAIFANTANPQALVDALADEVGDVTVVDLYVGSLSEPGGEASTYADLMATNARRISDALTG